MYGIDTGYSFIAAVRKIPQDDQLFQNENVLSVIMDITRPDEIRAAVEKGIERFGQIDLGMQAQCISLRIPCRNMMEHLLIT